VCVCRRGRRKRHFAAVSFAVPSPIAAESMMRTYIRLSLSTLGNCVSPDGDHIRQQATVRVCGRKVDLPNGNELSPIASERSAEISTVAPIRRTLLSATLTVRSISPLC